MKHPMVVVVLVFSVLAALALGTGGCTEPGAPEVFRNPDSPVYVNINDEFAIALEANHTTGYSWQLAQSFDSEVLELVSNEYEAPKTDVVGAPGEEKWTFKAIGEGRTVLSFTYVRPWETQPQTGGAATGTETAQATGSETGHSTPSTTSTTSTETATTAAAAENNLITETNETMTFTVDVGPAGSTTKEAKQYTKDNADTPIEAELGAEFALALESNPTTGYKWQLADPLDESVVVLVSQEYEQTKQKEGEETVGAGGEEIWTFRAVGHGETEISLKYVRSWEAGSPSDETVTFTVDVKQGEE